MANRFNRRTFLTGTAAAGAGLYLGAGPIRRASAAGAITVGVEAGSPYEKFYGERAAAFTRETGVEVAFNAIPHDNIRQQFALDAMSGAGGFDVYIADQPWLPEFAEKGFIVDLTDHIDPKDKADFAGRALETVSWGGKLYALPIIVHNCPMYYRSDLLEAVGLSAGPATWEEYREWAKKLTRDGVYGTLIAGKQDIEATTRLQSFIQQAGGDILDADNKPTFDSDAGHAALELMLNIADVDGSSPPGVLAYSDMMGLWLDGKLALAPMWPHMYTTSQDPNSSKVVGKVKLDIPPGNPDRVATAYSWGFCAASGSKNPDAAIEWVKWSTSSDVLADFAKTWVNPVPRTSSIERVKADPSVSDEQKAAIEVFARSAAGSKTMNMVPQYSQLMEVMAVIISGVMSKAKTPDEALKEAQAKAEEIMAG
jgi:ABC-type glycerol-3-phosphate transport system substrate-binding protein